VKPSFLFATVLAIAGCGKNTSPNAAVPSTNASSAEAASLPEGGNGGEPMDRREAEAWARAREGDDDDRMRLADLLGCTGLRERASDRELRKTAIRAMAYCNDFSELPWLAEVGAGKDDEEALAALDAIVSDAARPRRATDPEDADELGAGCAALLALARGTDRPRPRRVLAVRALRMLADWGCVRRSEIPSDVDAK